VKDYDVDASVLFNFAPVPTGIKSKAQYAVTLNGDTLTTSVTETAKLIHLADKQVHSQVNGSILNMAVTYNVLLIKPAEILSPFAVNIAGFAIKQDTLVFTTGHVEHPETFQPKIRVVQSNKKLIDRDLKQNEYRLANAANNSTVVIVDLAKLGLKLDKSQPATVRATIKLVLAGKILNPKLLPAKAEKVANATVRVE
jgi:hypothetical protein